MMYSTFGFYSFTSVAHTLSAPITNLRNRANARGPRATGYWFTE